MLTAKPEVKQDTSTAAMPIKLLSLALSDVDASPPKPCEIWTMPATLLVPRLNWQRKLCNTAEFGGAPIPNPKATIATHCITLSFRDSISTEKSAVVIIFIWTSTWNTAAGRCDAPTYCKLFCRTYRPDGTHIFINSLKTHGGDLEVDARCPMARTSNYPYIRVEGSSIIL